jgi:hypothetical protein
VYNPGTASDSILQISLIEINSKIIPLELNVRGLWQLGFPTAGNLNWGTPATQLTSLVFIAAIL